ncbi:MAG: BLUF domain-containing protein [Phycisphaerales bacterium]
MSLFHLVYISRAARDLDESDLLQIQQTAASRNAKVDITGVLLHSKGHFIQLLEGPPANLAVLYSQITNDGRHEACDCVMFGPASERMFSDWSMGVLDLDNIGDKDDTARLWQILGEEIRKPANHRDAALNTLREFERVLDATGGVTAPFV